MWAALKNKLRWRQLCVRFKTDVRLSNILPKAVLATPGVEEKAAEKLKESTRMLLGMTLVTCSYIRPVLEVTKAILSS